MEKQVKVSVIMSVYNPEPFDMLKEAVESVLAQTVRELELLLYNDGSDPEVSGQIRMLAALDPRIRYLESRQNRGIARGLNCCIRHARGDLIARMDADDRMLPDRLEKQMQFLESRKEYAYVGTGAWLFDEKGIWGERVMKEKPENTDFLRFSPYIHPSVMFRREVFETCGLYTEAEDRRRCEDYELFSRLHILGCPGYNLQEKLLCYREDKAGWKKRKLCYRLDEMKFRRERFRHLGLTGIKARMFCYRPLAAGLLPAEAIRLIKRKQAARAADCKGADWNGLCTDFRQEPDGESRKMCA